MVLKEDFTVILLTELRAFEKRLSARWDGTRTQELIIDEGPCFDDEPVFDEEAVFDQGPLFDEEPNDIAVVDHITYDWSAAMLHQASSTSFTDKETALDSDLAAVVLGTIAVVPSNINISAPAKCSMKCPRYAVDARASTAVCVITEDPIISLSCVAVAPTAIAVMPSNINADVPSTYSMKYPSCIVNNVAPAAVYTIPEEVVVVPIHAPVSSTSSDSSSCISAIISGKLDNMTKVTLVDRFQERVISCREIRPWPPPTELQITASGAMVRPSPWPSFNMYSGCIWNMEWLWPWKPPWSYCAWQSIRCAPATALIKFLQGMTIISLSFGAVKLLLSPGPISGADQIYIQSSRGVVVIFSCVTWLHEHGMILFWELIELSLWLSPVLLLVVRASVNLNDICMTLIEDDSSILICIHSSRIWIVKQQSIMEPVQGVLVAISFLISGGWYGHNTEERELFGQITEKNVIRPWHPLEQLHDQEVYDGCCLLLKLHLDQGVTFTWNSEYTYFHLIHHNRMAISVLTWAMLLSIHGLTILMVKQLKHGGNVVHAGIFQIAYRAGKFIFHTVTQHREEIFDMWHTPAGSQDTDDYGMIYPALQFQMGS